MTTENQKPMIIIVDDDLTQAKVLSYIFRQDYITQIATSGVEGIRLVSELQPDLVLLDVMMPDLDGLDVCERLKANPRTRQIPVIFLTNLDDFANQEKCFEVGATDLITKPYSPKLVKFKVQRNVSLFGELAHVKRIVIEQALELNRQM